MLDLEGKNQHLIQVILLYWFLNRFETHRHVANRIFSALRIVRMKQFMRFMPQRLAEELLIKRDNSRVLVRFTDR